MKGISWAYDFCTLSQRDFHNKHHEGLDGEVSCGRMSSFYNCEGVNLSTLQSPSEYESGSPLRNAFNRWGQVPGLAVVTGLSRWSFSLVEMGMGALGVLVGTIHKLGALFFGFDPSRCAEYDEWVGARYAFGCYDFWIGLKEVASIGFHRPIEEKLSESRAWNALVRRIWGVS